MSADDERKFYGKYRGKVTDGDDKGRLKILVPDIHPDTPLLAEPCLPYLSKNSGFLFLPPVDASVWVEFEQGDIDAPIWTGCCFPMGTQSINTEAGFDKDKVCLQTPKGCSIVLDDSAGKIILKTGNATLTVSDDGITITTGKGATINLSNAKVSINDTALEVE